MKLVNELEACKEKLNKRYEPASVENHVEIASVENHVEIASIGNHEKIAMYADLPTSNLNDEEIESDEIVTFERVVLVSFCRLFELGYFVFYF